MLEVEDGHELLGSALEPAGGGSIAVDFAHRRTFAGFCAALWNPELYELLCDQLRGEVTVENVVNRLRFLSPTRCDVSTELEFIASHFLRCPDILNAWPFSLPEEIVGHGSLRLESEDSLHGFISEGTEMNRGMFSLLEFVRFKYSSMAVMNNFFTLLSEYSCEVNASMWASPLRSVRSSKHNPETVPSIDRKGNYLDVPDGIIAHLTRECGGNVHDRHVIDVTSGLFEENIQGVNPDSGLFESCPWSAAKNTVDLEADSDLQSDLRWSVEDIPQTWNNWCATISMKGGLCQLTTQFTHMVIRFGGVLIGNRGSSRRRRTGRTGGRSPTRRTTSFIQLVNIGRNHSGSDHLNVYGREIFGSLLE
jgi:hypothetical protein